MPMATNPTNPTKFDNIFHLIEVLKDKDFSKLEITISEQVCEDNACMEPECQILGDLTKLVVFETFYNKPEMEFQISDKNILVVENFQSIPNSCGTTKMKIGNSEILIGICEESGVAKAKFDVSIDGVLHAGKEFIIVSDSSKYTNTVCLDNG